MRELEQQVRELVEAQKSLDQKAQGASMRHVAEVAELNAELSKAKTAAEENVRQRVAEYRQAKDAEVVRLRE